MDRPTGTKRTIWAIPGIVACLLWPALLVGDLQCEHCIGPARAHEQHDTRDRTTAVHHGMPSLQQSVKQDFFLQPESIERADRPSSSDAAGCCGEEGSCPSDGQMDSDIREFQGLASSPSLSSSALGAETRSAGEPAWTEPRRPSLPLLRWDDSPPVFLLVASFLL